MLRLTGTVKICKGGDARRSEDGKYFMYRGISFHPTKPELNYFVSFFDYGISEKRAKLVREGAIIEVTGVQNISIYTNSQSGETIPQITCMVELRDIILFAPRDLE